MKPIFSIITPTYNRVDNLKKLSKHLLSQKKREFLEWVIVVEKDDFAITIKTFISYGGKGANVTVPFKEQALLISDHFISFLLFIVSVSASVTLYVCM